MIKTIQAIQRNLPGVPITVRASGEIIWPKDMKDIPTAETIKSWITEHEAYLATVQDAQTSEQSLRDQDIMTNLPSWSEVSANIDKISDLAGAKASLKALARVVYWLAKNKST